MTTAELAASLLAAAVASLSPDAPARRMVTIGPPTDPLQTGDQIGVGWIRNFVGVPGQEQSSPGAQCWGPQVAEFIVRLVRCSPTSTSEQDTDPATMTEAATDLMDEAETMRLALRAWAPESVLSGEDLWVGPLTAVRSQGLVFAAQVTVHVAT